MNRIGACLACLLWVVVVLLSGCSFHVGFDYNGKTGVDNRTTTKLVKEAK